MNVVNKIIGFFKPSSTEVLVDEFAKSFPGKCMICSFHKYGKGNGMAQGEVEKHECIEE